MTFRHGFVHCDPHPGNVLIRRRQGTNCLPQLVLLDHGLYRSVPNPLRLQYCKLWKSIVLADVVGIKDVSDEMGLYSSWMEKKYPGYSHTMIASILTGKSWEYVAHSGSALDRLDTTKTAEQEREILSQNVNEYLWGIIDILNSAPRPLLLLLKTNDALRSAALKLGGRSTDTFLVTVKTCLRVLQEAPFPPEMSLLGQLCYHVELMYAICRCHIFVMWQDFKDTFLLSYSV